MRANVVRLAIAGGLLVLVAFAPLPGQSRLVQELHNAAHALIFGVVALLTLQVLRAHGLGASRTVVQYVAALSITALLGAATELIQIPVGRDASFIDMRNDLLGAVAFLAAFAAVDSRIQTSAWTRPVLLSIGAALLVATSRLTFEAALEQIRREAQFPVLVDFARRFDGYYMSPQWAEVERAPLPAPWGTGEQALHVRFKNGPWPGLSFNEPSPDWSRYSSLHLDITNSTNAPLRLVIRVHDRQHSQQFDDRFNGRYDVAARGRSVVTIPLARIREAPSTRTMNMRDIAGVILFRTQDSQAAEMYLTRIWLTVQSPS